MAKVFQVTAKDIPYNWMLKMRKTKQQNEQTSAMLANPNVVRVSQTTGCSERSTEACRNTISL